MEWEIKDGILVIDAGGYCKVSFIPPEGLDFGARYLIFVDTLPDNDLVHVVGQRLVIGFRQNRAEPEIDAGFTVPISDYPNLKNARKMTIKQFVRIWDAWSSIVHAQYLSGFKGLPKNEEWSLTMMRAQHLMSALGQTFDWSEYNKIFNQPFYL